MMTRDGGSRTPSRQFGPTLIDERGEAGGHRLAHRERSLGGVGGEFEVTFERPVRCGFEPRVRDRYASAGRNCQSRCANAGVLVVLPPPGALLPANSEFALIMQSARDPHQLFD